MQTMEVDDEERIFNELAEDIIEGWIFNILESNNNNNTDSDAEDDDMMQGNEINMNDHLENHQQDVDMPVLDDDWLLQDPFNNEDSSSDDDDSDLEDRWVFNNLFESDEDSTDMETDEEEPEKERRVCIENFVEQTVPRYSETGFKKHFRLLRPTAYQLIDRYQETLDLANEDPEPNYISSEKTMLLTFWYLANLETFRQVADRFNLSRSSAHQVLMKGLDFLCLLGPIYIRWPDQREHKEEISHQFFQCADIRGVVGAIDGCHIPILRPHENHVEYRNRKKFYSVLLQATVTREKLFTDVYIGEPGSMHDARVYRRSPLYARIYRNPDFLDGYFLIGDSAYSLSQSLVRPFRDNGFLTDRQQDFNTRLSSTRVSVEHAFGLLKQRFRRLQKLHNRRLDIIVKCIMASCVLHNICILGNDIIDQSDEDESEDDTDDEQLSSDEDDLNCQNGRNRRDQLMNELYGDDE